MLEQRGLADAGLAAEDEHPALPGSHVREQRVEDRALAAAATQLGVCGLFKGKEAMLSAGSAGVNRGGDVLRAMMPRVFRCSTRGQASVRHWRERLSQRRR